MSTLKILTGKTRYRSQWLTSRLIFQVQVHETGTYPDDNIDGYRDVDVIYWRDATVSDLSSPAIILQVPIHV